MYAHTNLPWADFGLLWSSKHWQTQRETIKLPRPQWNLHIVPKHSRQFEHEFSIPHRSETSTCPVFLQMSSQLTLWGCCKKHDHYTLHTFAVRRQLALCTGTSWKNKSPKATVSGERKLASCLWGGCWPTHVTHWSLHLEDWEQRSSFATWLQNLLVLHPPHMTLLVTTIYNPFLDRNVFCLTGIMMSACKNLSTHFWWLDFKSEWLKCRQVSLTTSTTTWLAWFCLLATQKCLAWSWHACGLRHWNMATSNLTNWAKGQNPRMQRKYLVMLALNIQLLQGMYCSIWVLSEHGFNDI